MSMGNAQHRFEALVNVCSGDLYRFAFWLCRDQARAQDLVQETFLRAWRALSSLRDEKAAKAWLIMILRREYARGFERYRPTLEDADPDELGSTAQAPTLEALLLRRELGRLPSDYSEPLLMQVLGGMSCEEIAADMKLSKAAVMTRLFRARQKLRKALEGDDSSKFNDEMQL